LIAIPISPLERFAKTFPNSYTGQMKPSTTLDAHRAEVRAIVLANHTLNARVFGSVARGQDTETSDLDILVDPTPETSLMDIGAIRFQLRELLGVPVDVLTPMALPEHFRATVLAEAKLV
jgi:uncharacterized protein